MKFEERLWSIIRNFVTLGREMPAMLVNAVRIVELQELVDAKLEASAHRMCLTALIVNILIFTCHYSWSFYLFSRLPSPKHCKEKSLGARPTKMHI